MRLAREAHLHLLESFSLLRFVNLARAATSSMGAGGWCCGRGGLGGMSLSRPSSFATRDCGVRVAFRGGVGGLEEIAQAGYTAIVEDCESAVELGEDVADGRAKKLL